MNPEFLYKYRAVNQFTLMALINRTVWCSKPKELNDPFDSQLRIDHQIPSKEEYELLVSAAFKEWANETGTKFLVTTPSAAFEGDKLSDGFINDIYKFKEHVESCLADSPILSLSEVFDSTTMWSHYADSHKGICIEYDTKNLFPQQGRHNTLHKVVYKKPKDIYFNSFDIHARCCANRNDEKYQNIINEINSTKTEDWSYEKEWRSVNGHSGLSSHGEKAVTSIYFGLKCGLNEKVTIRNILHDKPMSFFQMARSKNGLQIEAIEMDRESIYWQELPQ